MIPKPDSCLYCNKSVDVQKWHLCHRHYIRWREKRPMDAMPNEYTKPRRSGVNVHGYTTITVHGRGKLLEHRYLMEQVLHRPLQRNELINHKNGNRRDNKLENLEVISRSDHMRLHNKVQRAAQPRCPHCGRFWNYRDIKFYVDKT